MKGKNKKIKIVSPLEVLDKRRRKRESISGIQSNFLDHCFHVGKISYGCRNCFIGSKYNYSFCLGSECNLNCNYCYLDSKTKEGRISEKQIDNGIAEVYRRSLFPDYGENGPHIIGFTAGEPLLNLQGLERVMKELKEIEKRTESRPYYKVYTNGTLASKEVLKRLKHAGIDELRFHLSASNFSKKVYKNMEEAVKLGFIVAVEEPSYPKHRKKLFAMLPFLDKIGVKHLQLITLYVYPHNISHICFDHPNAQFFHDYRFHLDDNGLPYDIMKEVLRKKYRFSVLDCSPEVHRHNYSSAKNLFSADPKNEEKDVFYNPFKK